MNESMEKIGKYRILQRLGKGSFGAVYLAHDEQVNRNFAIKVFQPQGKTLIAFANSSSEDGLQVLRERFVQEAQILGKLADCPYIVDVYQFGYTEKGSPYYVMPYVKSHLGQLLGQDVFDRETLDELDQSAHPRALPLDKCLTLLHQILLGMKAAHDHKLVHRDIKPLNILFSDAGQVRIADFGIAKAPGGTGTGAGQFMGSHDYTAPEQLKSAKDVDERADIYSIGKLAYRMLTGRLPTGRYEDPEKCVTQLGNALNLVILKAMSENKEKRFRDAGKMLAAYEKALQQRTQEDKAGSQTTTDTVTTSDGPVSGLTEKFQPLYNIIKETLLEHGAITPKRQREIDGMVAVLQIDGEVLKSIVAEVTEKHNEIPALQELLNLIEREIEKLPAQTAGKKAQTQKKRLINDLFPAAELAGKDKAWLKARLEEALKAQNRSSPRASSHRTSKQVAGSSDARSGKRRVLLVVVAIVAVSVVGLWFSIGPEPGETFRDPLADGGEGPLMVVLPAGRFSMGCSDCSNFLQPVHDVTLPNNFAMAVYEVSFAEYDRYVQVTGVRRPGDEGWGRGYRPVINVDWEEARAYARWLSEQTGRSYRLPTEAEWEYAARAGTTTEYSWGNRASHEQANYGTDECCSGLVQGSDRWEYTAPVGSFPANGFGLYDMHGNVFEWTQDCWHQSYDGAPTNGQAWEGANGGDCDVRVARGGSWSHGPLSVRPATRAFTSVSNRHFVGGFRLVQDLP